MKPSGVVLLESVSSVDISADSDALVSLAFFNIRQYF
jgi:hypothetical protein